MRIPRKLKSFIIFNAGFVLILPMAVMASFDRDLYFGLKNDQDVSRLQGFLKEQGIFQEPISGNFFGLTEGAVKKLQEREGIAPVKGYFGLKTRTRVNAIILQVAPSKDTQILALTSQLQILRAKLAELQKKAQEEKLTKTIVASTTQIISAASTTPETPTTTISTTTPVVVTPVPQLEVSGTRTAAFPDIVTSPLKIGDFTIKNGTLNDILFSQVVAKVSENMNSTLNRGRGVYWVLRSGTTIFDDIISTTKFTFNSNSPQTGITNQSFAMLSYPVVIKAGVEKTISLWIENLEIVYGGTLRVEMDSLLATTQISPVGGFTFVLTK